MAFLFVLFVVLPISEIMLIIEVSDNIGGWNTFWAVVVTAFFGAYFVKREGIATLNRVQQKAAQGELPGLELIEGIFLLIAGVLLVTPGFITDFIGFMFTLPFSRRLIARNAVSHLQKKQATGQNAFYFNFQQSQTYQRPPNQNFDDTSANGETIDGDYKDMTENDKKNRLE